MNNKVELNSEICCPKCQHKEMESMPTDSCQWFYECKGCKAMLSPINNDCCVFCSYGTIACPPIQLDSKACSDDCC